MQEPAFCWGKEGAAPSRECQQRCLRPSGPGEVLVGPGGSRRVQVGLVGRCGIRWGARLLAEQAAAGGEDNQIGQLFEEIHLPCLPGGQRKMYKQADGHATDQPFCLARAVGRSAVQMGATAGETHRIRPTC